jgi:hypothetical protein
MNQSMLQSILILELYMCSCTVLFYFLEKGTTSLKDAKSRLFPLHFNKELVELSPPVGLAEACNYKSI